MGFKSLIDNQVKGAMAILGQVDGLAPFGVYIEKGARSYDTATRTYSSTDTNHPNVPMVFAKFTVDEMDDEVVTSTDQKVLIAALDLPVSPKSQDAIIDAKGGTFNIERLLGVPGDSLHILHVRKV